MQSYPFCFLLPNKKYKKYRQISKKLHFRPLWYIIFPILINYEWIKAVFCRNYWKHNKSMCCKGCSFSYYIYNVRETCLEFVSHLGCIMFPSQGFCRSKCFLLWVVYVHFLFVSCWIWAVRPNRHSKGLVEGLALMHRHRETRHTPDSSIRRHGARYISSFQREIFRSYSACHFVLEDERRGWWNGLNTNDFFWTRIPHEPLARRSQFP